MNELNSHRRWVCALALLISLSACGGSPAEQEAKQKGAAYREKYAKAKSLFDERCKTAGVVVHRVVKDVDGIELAKVRREISWGGKEYFDPMYPEAAMAGEIRGDDYIKQFLMYEFRNPQQPGARGQLGPLTIDRPNTRPEALSGYSFVEFVDPVSGDRLRCTPDWSRNHPNWVTGQHHCISVKASGARYALDYEDLVDPADRALWVAGTKLKVIDKLSGEVIAQLTRFVWDQGFGGSSTGRWPWQHANGGASHVCPSDASQPLHHDARYFVDQVLIPKQGNQRDRGHPGSGS